MSRIGEITELFASVDRDTRLELLLDYADRLPPLPEVYHPLRDAGLNLVHECQSPVFLMVEVRDGQVQLHADVPRQAPTARGFTSILVEAFDGSAPPDVEAAPGARPRAAPGRAPGHATHARAARHLRAAPARGGPPRGFRGNPLRG